MRVAIQHSGADFALSDHITAPPDWSAEDINGASRVLDGLIRSGTDVERATFFKAQMRELAGDLASAASWLDRLSSTGPGEPADGYDFDRQLTFADEFDARAGVLKRLGLEKPVYMTCLPQTGADYLTSCLAHLLGTFRVRTARGLWGRGTLVQNWTQTALSACAVMHDRFPASEPNLSVLAPETDLRLLVHVRHPADCLAALYHHLNDTDAGHNLQYPLARDLGVPYFRYEDESAEARKTWLIKMVYPALIKWTEDWLQAMQRLGERLIFCRYEDLRSHEIGLLVGILAHAGYDADGLPALDGGAPVELEDKVLGFQARCRRSGLKVPGEGGDEITYGGVFARSQCDLLARFNDSPIFEALDYEPVDPASAEV